jgi:predicted kinase
MPKRGGQDAWWSLPGPARFLERAAAMANIPSGVLGVLMPMPAPRDWLMALTYSLDEQASATPVVVDASVGLHGRSPVRMLATAAGLETAGLRLVAGFVDEPALADTIFLVHGVSQAEWRQWSLFLRSFRAERQREPRLGAPSIVLAVPPAIPPDDLHATLGAPPLRWMGVLTRLDTRLYVERVAGRQSDDLLSRVAMETTVEFAGWDREMTRALACLTLEQQLDPVPMLEAFAESVSSETPCWENALVDHWDGAPHISTLALIAAKEEAALRARLWGARVCVVFPFIDAVRLAFATKYEGRLRAALPLTKNFNDRSVTYTDPFKLEFYDLKTILGPLLPRDERTLLEHCYRLRTAMAHSDPGDGYRIVQASALWERLESDFPAASTGWDWPRCGQRLVLLIGPSGAGKSTYAAEHYDPAEIVSSDAIREEIFGSSEADGDQGPVFERLRDEVRHRLGGGRRAVIDATHIKATDRIANARLAPADIPVEYVVIDRPMADKVTTAGWRARRPGLLETHAGIFAENIDANMARDGLPNVRVTVPTLGGSNPITVKCLADEAAKLCGETEAVFVVVR